MSNTTQFQREQKAHRKNELIEMALDAGIIPLYNDKEKDKKLFVHLKKLSIDELRDQLNKWEKAAAPARANLPEISIVK